MFLLCMEVYMTLKHMKIFYEVCKLESITKAAESLNMAQPAVSLAIKELESYYGIILFERMNRRIYITDAGKNLLSYATTIISQFNEAENAIRNSDILSTLRVGCNATIGSTLLPAVLEDFTSKYPTIDLKCIIANTKQTELHLLKNNLDIAIVDNISISSHFNSKLLFKEELIVVCGLKYNLNLAHEYTLEDLSNQKLLMREKGSGLRNSIDLVFHMYGLSPEPIIESISINSLIESAIHNLGILIVSKSLVESYLAKGQLLQLKTKDIHFLRNYYIIYHKNKYITNTMNNFIKEVLNNINYPIN